MTTNLPAGKAMEAKLFEVGDLVVITRPGKEIWRSNDVWLIDRMVPHNFFLGCWDCELVRYTGRSDAGNPRRVGRNWSRITQDGIRKATAEDPSMPKAPEACLIAERQDWAQADYLLRRMRSTSPRI